MAIRRARDLKTDAPRAREPVPSEAEGVGQDNSRPASQPAPGGRAEPGTRSRTTRRGWVPVTDAKGSPAFQRHRRNPVPAHAGLESQPGEAAERAHESEPQTAELKAPSTHSPMPRPHGQLETSGKGSRLEVWKDLLRKAQVREGRRIETYSSDRRAGFPDPV